MSQFYALLPNNEIRQIRISEDISDDIRNQFIVAGNNLMPDGIEEDLFSGDIVARSGENITYVCLKLPEAFNNIPGNQADIPDYDINTDSPKSLFWYDNGKYYFQLFNRRNLLDRKCILRKVGNTFNRMRESAFILEDYVQAIYNDGKFYFQSYASANHIFSLADFVTEATNNDIDNFGTNTGIDIDVNRLKRIANIKTRRLIKSISLTENVESFMGKTSYSKNKMLRDYGVKASIDDEGGLKILTKRVADLNRVLEFLNEDIFSGIITKKRYLTNSKKHDS